MKTSIYRGFSMAMLNNQRVSILALPNIDFYGRTCGMSAAASPWSSSWKAGSQPLIIQIYWDDRPPQGNPRYPKVENSGHWSISWWYQISYPQLSQLRVRLRPTVSGRTRALRCPPMRGGATSLWIGSVRSYLSASSWVKLVDPWNWENRRFFGGQYLRWRETRGLNPRRGSLGLNIHFQDPKTDVL